MKVNKSGKEEEGEGNDVVLLEGEESKGGRDREGGRESDVQREWEGGGRGRR